MFRSLVRLLNVLSLGRDTYRALSDRGFAGSTYYNLTYWEPQRYFAWTDTVRRETASKSASCRFASPKIVMRRQEKIASMPSTRNRPA